MLFVCPRFEEMDREMLSFSRLYAFPTVPDQHPLPIRGGIVILDSGAFGLSQRGQQINPGWMWRLAQYYEQFSGENIYCIAPDVFLNPRQTIANWEWWQREIGLPVVPVIQFSRRKRIGLYEAMRQADFYARWKPAVVAISNPGLTALESEGIAEVCSVVRTATGASWLHNLGAGWSPRDVRDWRELACFDSIDSVAYYTDAQAGWRWRLDGGCELCDIPWRELAVENARVATGIARGVDNEVDGSAIGHGGWVV